MKTEVIKSYEFGSMLLNSIDVFVEYLTNSRIYVENELLRLVETLEQKRDNGDWIETVK